MSYFNPNSFGLESHEPLLMGFWVLHGLMMMVAPFTSVTAPMLATLASVRTRSRISQPDQSVCRDYLPSSPAVLSKLTEREARTLAAICAGNSYADIAAEQSVSETTVKMHTRNLHRKLDANSPAQLVVRAAHYGYVTLR